MSQTRGVADVLLIFPGRHNTSNPQIPLSLLHVAAPLMRKGYRVRILDMRVENYRDVELGRPIFVGISSMSGIQIRYGLEVAKTIRAANPSIPIVWGGVHPSLLPEQTAVSELVDVVVRGEGESTVVDLAETLESGRPLDGVTGVTYKSGGQIRSNPDGGLIDLDTIPVDLPYDLLPLDRYPSLTAGRFHIQTSRGCPHSCGFCYNSVFNKRRWRAKSANRVLDEFEYLVKRFPQIRCMDPIDDNFFVDRKRVEDICRGLIDRKIDVKWRANCRLDYMAGYDKDFLALLERSGCIELNFGAETGSPRLLSLIDKGVTPDQMVKAIANLRDWAPSIDPYVIWMSGLPGETEEDLKVTFELMDRISNANDKTQHVGIFIYTPFPCPLLESHGAGFKLPQSLEEWGNIDVFNFDPPWHSKEYVKRLQTISAVTRYAFYPQDRIREFPLPYRVAYKMANKVALYRWRHKFFGMPVEFKVINALARRVRGFL